MIFETASTTESYQDICQDRIAVFSESARTVVVVADGAGGAGAGDQAAKTVVEEVCLAFPNVHSSAQWCDCLRRIDHRIGSGESTAVVVDLRSDGVFGASVGDSQAWVVNDARINILTSGQHRKPLLGSGNAVPVGFEVGTVRWTADRCYGRLLQLRGTRGDGKSHSLRGFRCPAKAARGYGSLAFRALNDDVGIVVCRSKRPARDHNRVFALRPEDFA